MGWEECEGCWGCGWDFDAVEKCWMDGRMGRFDGEGRGDKIDELTGNEYEVLEGALSEGGNIIVELAHSCLMCVVVLRIVNSLVLQ